MTLTRPFCPALPRLARRGRRAAWILFRPLALPLIAALVLCTLPSMAQQENAESRSFKHAANAFQDGLYERAQRDFQQFVTAYPQSPMLAEALLLQARAALRLSNAPTAIALLSGNLFRAGSILDQYRYWLGKAHLDHSNYVAAAEVFASIPLTLTNSTLLLEASHAQALARFRLGQYPAVISLLQDPEGGFQRASRGRPNDELAIRGRMLLAEALFRQQQYRPAAAVLATLTDDRLTPDFRWDRTYLLCRLLVAERRLADAVEQSTNLVAAAVATGHPSMVADSIMVQADILQQLGRFDEAINAYSRNLTDGAPTDRRRLALLNLIELRLAQDRIAEAGLMLESFLAKHPDDAAADVVLLTLGELQLKLYLAGRGTNAPNAAETNRLQNALTHFDSLLATNKTGPLAGKAQLNKGWCLWLDRNLSGSATAFQAALELLPPSEDQAVARFKLADTLFEQKDYTNALAHYRALTNDYREAPRVRSALFDQALYQMVQTSIALGDETSAAGAMRHLLEAYPESLLADRSLFLVGQELLRVRQPAQARARLNEFLTRFPASPLRPEVELALARTHFQEGAWTAAIASYNQWLEHYPTNQARPRAAFNRAWSYYRAGQDTNALNGFTRFVEEFPLDVELAPKAQYWIADHFHREQQYREAIRNFQVILENTNWPTTALTYQARLRAGMSAFSAQLWNDAGGTKGHFPVLIGDDNCPPDIAAQAWFAYGDTLISWLAPTNAIDKYREAKEAFSRIIQKYTNSPLVAAAWGRVGDCYLQMASQDPKQFGEATNAYLRVMTDPSAGIALRSQAEFGLARALELQSVGLPATEGAGLQKAAFDHFYNIVNGDNLNEGEKPDPFWLQNAGLEAARIAEGQKQWNIAIAIFQRLQRVLEPLRPRLEERIRRIQEARRLQTD